MGWFRRRRSEPVADSPLDPRTPWPEQEVPSDPEVAAREFWHRWHELLPDLSAALGDGEPQRVEQEVCAAVAAMHPNLQVSIERGQRAIYALVVTGQEDPGLRPYTDAWKAAAPPDDAIWEFHDCVPPVPDPTEVAVNVEGRRVDLAEVRVVAQVDDEDRLVDVAVYHPVLAELGEQARTALTFLPLDATLGERLAAERIRRVETAVAEPEGTIGLLELRELVHGLAGNEKPGHD